MHANCLIDTETTLTLLSQTLYETIPHETRLALQNSKQNILAANGGKLFVLGKTDLTLTINDMVIHNDALVAQINADGILGLDFMLVNSCSVDVSHKVLLLKDKRIPLLLEGYIGCNRITAIKTVSKPPRAELFTVGQVLKNNNRIPTNTCLEEPFASGQNKIIYPGTVIGQLSEVKFVESSEEDMTGQIKRLRPDLVEMLQKTDNHLTRKQKREAHSLLY